MMSTHAKLQREGCELRGMDAQLSCTSVCERARARSTFSTTPLRQCKTLRYAAGLLLGRATAGQHVGKRFGSLQGASSLDEGVGGVHADHVLKARAQGKGVSSDGTSYVQGMLPSDGMVEANVQDTLKAPSDL